MQLEIAVDTKSWNILLKQNDYVKEDKLNILLYIKIKWSDIICACKLLSAFETYF